MSQGNEEVKTCRDCGSQIVWMEGINRRGETKVFPFNHPPTINVTTGQTNYERHRCAEYEERRASQYKSLPTSQKGRGIPCNVCGAPITFSEDQRSPKTGKMIPLELSLERHEHRTPQTQQQYGYYSNNLQQDKVFEQQQGNIPEERIVWEEEDETT